MKLCIVSGSHRKDSESARVAAYLEARVAQYSLFESVSVIDLGKTEIPFWDEGVWQGDEKWKETWGPISATLTEADAYIIITPEWAGMVPPKLKNFLLLTNGEEVGHKPALIVSISAGLGGSFPVAELRNNGYKNAKLSYMPDHLIVRNVKDSLHGDEPASEQDESIRERIDHTLQMLANYSKGYQLIRDQDFDYNKYKYGMS